MWNPPYSNCSVDASKSSSFSNCRAVFSKVCISWSTCLSATDCWMACTLVTWELLNCSAYLTSPAYLLQLLTDRPCLISCLRNRSALSNITLGCFQMCLRTIISNIWRIVWCYASTFWFIFQIQRRISSAQNISKAQEILRGDPKLPQQQEFSRHSHLLSKAQVTRYNNPLAITIYSQKTNWEIIIWTCQSRRISLTCTLPLTSECIHEGR